MADKNKATSSDRPEAGRNGEKTTNPRGRRRTEEKRKREKKTLSLKKVQRENPCTNNLELASAAATREEGRTGVALDWRCNVESAERAAAEATRELAALDALPAAAKTACCAASVGCASLTSLLY